MAQHIEDTTNVVPAKAGIQPPVLRALSEDAQFIKLGPGFRRDDVKIKDLP